MQFYDLDKYKVLYQWCDRSGEHHLAKFYEN